jgi:hypothetical protein
MLRSQIGDAAIVACGGRIRRRVIGNGGESAHIRFFWIGPVRPETSDQLGLRRVGQLRRADKLAFWNSALRCQSKLTYHRETEGCCSVNRFERRDGASLFLSRSSAYIFALYCLCWGRIPFELPYYGPNSTSH